MAHGLTIKLIAASRSTRPSKVTDSPDSRKLVDDLQEIIVRDRSDPKARPEKQTFS